MNTITKYKLAAIVSIMFFICLALILSLCEGELSGLRNEEIQSSPDPVNTGGFSWCGRCKETWKTAKSHTTWYEYSSVNIYPDRLIGPTSATLRTNLTDDIEYTYPTRGCFPLCEPCWKALRTPANRLPYYRQLIREWQLSGSGCSPERVEEIINAVKDGK